MPRPTCCWVMADGKPCDRDVDSFYIKEYRGDDIKRRQYRTFCPRHESMQQERVNEEDEE